LIAAPREVTGERVRDKFAASKRKASGWAGFRRWAMTSAIARLVINDAEAKLVRRLFERFILLGGSTKVVREMKIEGQTTKSWTTQSGIHRRGKPITRIVAFSASPQGPNL
jgi:site-specific DNA recombinase